MLTISRQVTIPAEELEFSGIRAQGAGGQNVNKVSSAVHLRFDIVNSSLPEFYKQRLLDLNDQRISKDGVVIIKAQRSRSQQQNKEEALQRLKELIEQATLIEKPRRPTKPSRSSQRNRLDSKKKHGRNKALRNKIDYVFIAVLCAWAALGFSAGFHPYAAAAGADTECAQAGYDQTGPLRVTVLQASAAPPSASGVFLETTLEPDEPYVQSQMRYSVRLVYRGELVQSVFNDITIDGALVQQLGEIENYTTTRAAQEYQVSERHLAIFADTSGALTIPPVSVSGRLQQQNTDGSGRSRYFELHSEPRRVPVRARPLAYSGSDWLPAHELTLQAIWPQQPPQLYAGEPVELQLLIEARGLSPFQLPQLSLPSIEHASVYPGPSEDTSTSDQHHVTLRRQQQITIVAGRPGMLLVPEFKLDWWDTKQNLQRMAFVSAQLIPVLPAATALLRPGAADSAAERLPAAPPDATVFTVPWRWSASLLLLLWLMTLYGWWRERRTR